MNSSSACISILVKSDISKTCLINFLNELSNKSLRGYLKVANIYDGNSNKKKSDLIEMVIYGCINGNGNISKRKKDIKLYTEGNIKSSVKI